ncbi:hypothetical protein F8M41_001349 [Gigaspora margarita]|uniref:Uncharacterized protein n=1 Tax=Gigaspora margarita TaxID=4874 RepID=A0A8H3XEL5_GIGMA|nr:hypothetical protein F8M41_001349 [Gigaspora margarita]
MVVIIFLLVFLPTGFMQNTVKHSNLTYLTYKEKPSDQANLTEAQPHILTISRYSDNSGTAVVRITRVNYYNYFTMNYCYEQRLLLRVIKADGSVSEINYANATEIQDINYCNIGSDQRNPLKIYPLFDQYILVTYTHATNTSDTTTYVDRGMVFHWNGTIISNLEFGPSYLYPGTDWYPNEFIVNNITPENGFLRLSTVNGNETGSFKWSQYNGAFSLVHNDTIPGLLDPTSFQATAIATLDGGYALIYTNTTKRNFTSDNMLTAQFSANAGIYAVMLGYNPPKISQSFILYQLTTPNITFTGLYCSVDFVFIGHSCIAYAKPTQTTVVTSNTTNSGTFYVRIRFLSSGTIQSIDPMFPPNSGNLTNVRTLPFGGYAVITRVNNNRRNYNFTLDLYDEDGKLSEYDSTLKQITANFDGAFAVLRNNTILVALNETISSWQILLVDLPPLSQYNKSDYGNLLVRKAYPPTNFTDLPLNTNMISITFNVPVLLSDAKLAIYQKINNKSTLRQFINSTYCNYCILSTYCNNCMLSTNCNNCNISREAIILNVLSCTFNDPGGHYFIQMDNNFVKSDVYNEPILGIDKNMWNFQTDNITSSEKNTDNSGDIRGILRLTIDGSRYFQELNDSRKHDFFVTLIEQPIPMIPTENGRLESDKHYQLNSSNILISLFIYEAKDNEKLTAANIKDYLHQLIINKEFTVISMGNVTKFLDETYGFQQSQDIGKNHIALIIIVFIAFIILLLPFILSFKLKSKNFETIMSAALKIGLIIPNFVLLMLFVAYNSNYIPGFHLPSVLILSIPLLINFCIAIYAIYKGIKNPVIGENFKEWIIEYRGLVAIFTILVATDYEYLTILKVVPIFTKKLYRYERINTLNIFSIIDHIFDDVIIWGAFIDIFFRNIPQIIILAVSKFIILLL